jgi:RimJ/RimL family protein N-acetyltransferase
MATSYIPQVETERLILRPPTSADAEPWATRLYADAEVLRYIPPTNLTPLGRAEMSISNYGRIWERDGTGAWVITRKGEPRMCGYAFVKNLAEETGEYELGYGITRSEWGQGLTTEASRAALRFAFDHAPMPYIMAVVFHENMASVRVLEHLGFVYQKDAVYHDLPLAYYTLQREHFVSGDHLYRLTFSEPVEG